MRWFSTLKIIKAETLILAENRLFREQVMLKLSIGFLVGFVTAAGVIYIFGPNHENFAFAITNTVIAICSAVALEINRRSIQHQKELRRWEANKETLLKLATALSNAIDSTDKSHDARIMNNNDENDKRAFSELRVALQHTLDVYAVLLDQDLIDAVKQYKEQDNNITQAWNNDEIDIVEALEQSSEIQKYLLSKVNKSIKHYASL